MSIRLNDDGKILTMYLRGELDHHTAKKLREALDEKIRDTMPCQIVLDFSDLEFMDSSGIGFILGRYKLATELSATIELKNVPPAIAKVLRIAGIERLGIEISTEVSAHEYQA